MRRSAPPRVPVQASAGRYGRALPPLLLTVLLLAGCEPAPVSAPDVAVPTLDGRRLQLDAGGPVRYVTFWSTRCVICLRDMPELIALHERRGRDADDFEIIAIALSSDRPSDVVELATAAGLPFTVALDPGDRAIDGFDEVLGTPTGFLLDREGRAVSRYVGELDTGRLEADLRRLLGPAPHVGGVTDPVGTTS